MVYRFTQERQDHSDLAAGTVFHGLPGHPAFPIRLTSEIFQRCVELRAKDGQHGPCRVYDPCCGGGYLLSTLAFLHWHEISAVYGSDVDSKVLETANRNLSLLTVEGIDQRIAHIEAMIAQFGKESHREAYQSAQRIKAHLLELQGSHRVQIQTFCANIVTETLVDYLHDPVDMVITDIPYGSSSSWLGLPATAEHEPSWYMLQSLIPVLTKHSLVAVASNKQQKIAHERYERVERFQIGKRRVVMLRPIF